MRIRVMSILRPHINFVEKATQHSCCFLLTKPVYPSNGGPKYTIEISVFPYTAATVG